jgi:hypothetical protein
MEMALKGVQFIAQHIRNKDKDIEVRQLIVHTVYTMLKKFP